MKDPCYCDSPLCTNSWVCKQLGEYRITHRVLTEMRQRAREAQPDRTEEHTVDEILGDIESECEILVK
jgi:hypothetical protein